MAYTEDEEVKTTTSYEEMSDILTSKKVLIGHNIVCYDVPLIEKLLGIKIKAKLIDTLALSWYLNPKRLIHGLDSFGKDYGIPKPKIDDWENLSQEEYLHRCSEDVKINQALWKDFRSILVSLYDNDMQGANRLIEYLTFKMDCLREQEKSEWLLDVPRAERCLKELEVSQEEKVSELRLHMPRVIKYVEKTKPEKCFKKDGTTAVAGAKWLKLLRENNLPKDYEGGVKVVVSEGEANPAAHQQVKDWLYGLGWVPDTFDYKKDAAGNERMVPQLRKDVGGNKVLCHSVTNLIDDYPEVGLLEGLSIIQHRLSIFKGYLDTHDNGWVTASAGGFTNTLRLKHRKPLVNLPSVAKHWGKDIRGCLIAPEGYVLCGSDMVSLEDTTKRHYMYPHDPKYVEEMSQEGFDPHLDLAKHGGAATQQEIDDYVNGVEGAKNLKSIRANFKTANYACVYGVMKKTLSRQIKSSQEEADKLIKAYWKRNWAVKVIAEEQTVKTVDGQMWLLNPVSGFWYSLRYEKDIFSTLNQGTGVYCFDMWMMEFRKKRTQLTAQFHDEIISCIKPEFKERYTKLLKDSIKIVNGKLKLNIPLDVDIQFGDNYAEIH